MAADNKKLFRAVIIDDDPNRNSTYEEVLTHRYDITIINEIETLTRQKIMQHDLLVIDICLSKEVESLTAFKIIEEYDLSLPTVVVSSEWIDQNGQPNEFILQVPRFKNIIKVIGWNDFNKGNNKAIAGEIYYEFCKYKNYYLSKDADKCEILHISDIQIGGSVSQLSCNDNERIADYLSEKGISPDLLVITGDIADKGKKEEFDKARAWIEQLACRIWNVSSGKLSQSERERIILVPGNHDYDLSINASELYEFRFAQAEVDAFQKKENVESYKNQKLGFYNFIEFARKLTGDNSWNDYMEKPVHVITKFVNMGIQFFTINSVFNISNRNCENRFDSFYCDLSTVDDNLLKCSERVSGPVCNFLITHNAPSNFKNESSNGLKTWSRMQTLIEGYKFNACLYGHTHDSMRAYRLNDNGGSFCKKLICVAAPSVRLNAASRTEDSNRGFNVIECRKKDGVITSIYPRYFELQKATIVETTESDDEAFNVRL